MKLRTKSIITLVAMLLSGIGAFAEDGTSSPQWTVSYQYDGEASTSDAPGIVECTFSGTTATIVCRPLEGNYITAEDIIVEKTVSGDKAQTREVGIDSTPITITAASTNTTPRAESSYTFTAEADPNLTYEIKANFHQLKDLDTYALIALPENTIYTYTGQDIEPEFTVTAAGVDLTAGTDYTFKPTYMNNPKIEEGKDVFLLNGDGDSFNKTASDAVSITAFRPYFMASATAGSRSRKVQQIVFGQSDSHFGIDERDPREKDNEGTLSIYTKNHKVVVASTLKQTVDVNIITPAGVTLNTVTVEPGQTVETRMTNRGVYLVQSADGRHKKKLAVR